MSPQRGVVNSKKRESLRELFENPPAGGGDETRRSRHIPPPSGQRFTTWDLAGASG